MDGVRPGVNYFLRKFNVNFYDTMCTFQAAQIACPSAVQHLKPTPEDVQELRRFPFLDDPAIINDLQRELPDYCAQAEGARVNQGEQLQWWKDHSIRLPHWSTAAKKLAAVQPSSADAERVFLW